MRSGGTIPENSRCPAFDATERTGFLAPLLVSQPSLIPSLSVSVVPQLTRQPFLIDPLGNHLRGLCKHLVAVQCPEL